MRKTKFRLLSCVLAVMCCVTAFSVTAFASDGGGYYGSDESGEATPPDSIDSITVSTEGVHLRENQGSKALTPEGNLSLIDDIYQAEGYASDESKLKDKQFIVVQSKNGNYFYLVIDRSGDTENVYFLNMVDEADLMALMEDADGDTPLICTCDEKCVAGAVDTDCPVCKSNMSECIGKEALPDATPEPVIEPDGDTKPEEKSNSSLLIVLLVLILAGGGALYWFKFRKNKPTTKGPHDLDDYDYGEDDDDEEMEFETEDDIPAAQESAEDTEE